MSWKKPTEATGQRGRFRDHKDDSWYEAGRLTAMGVDCDGKEYFLCDGICWDECEVEDAEWVVPEEAVCQKARFTDDDMQDWYEGNLTAMGTDDDGNQFFVDGDRTTWDQCEVKAQDFI